MPPTSKRPRCNASGRLFIVDPNLRSLSGHYFTYVHVLTKAAEARGVACHIFGHQDVEPVLAAQHGITPAYRADIWRNATDEGYLSDSNFGIINREFLEDTIAALAGFELNAADTIFYPTLTGGQLSGIAGVVEQVAPGGARHEILLRYQPAFYEGAVAAAALRRLEAAAVRQPIRLSSDSHRLAYSLEALTSLPVFVYPIPHTSDPAPYASRRDEDGQPLHLVSLGNARGEKGLAEIAEAIRRSAGQGWGARLRFTLQVNDPSDDVVACVAALHANPDPRVTLISEPLEPEAYQALLHSADAVLVPYHHNVYEARTSGVFLEAAAAGKVVIATASTWMADLAEAQDHGLLVKDRSARDLERCLQRLADDFPALSAKAQAAAGPLRAVHNPANLLDHVLGNPAISAALPQRRHAAIFYPWGDIAGRSGAAARTTLLAKYLAESGRDVRILYLGDEQLELAPGIVAEGYRTPFSAPNPMRTRVARLVDSPADQASDSSVHLYYHLWPALDDGFVRRCQRMVRWADDIFVEYTYFATVVAPMARREDKTVALSVHDLLSEVCRGSEPLYGLTRAVERLALTSVDRVIVANSDEGRICAEDGVAVTVIPHPIDHETLRAHSPETVRAILEGIFELPLEGRSMCLFVGSRFGPNCVAAEAVREMAVRSLSDPRLSNVIYVVAGQAHEPMRTENFFALGRVEDMALDVLNQAAALVLIPLRDGTGMSVKTVEALARGAAILSTGVGMRGYPVIDGEHCAIENDLARYPDRIATLLAQPDQLDRLRLGARTLGEGYDYRVLFEAYRLPPEPDARRVMPPTAAGLTEFIRRFAAGGGTAEGLRWVMQHIDVDALGFEDLAALAQACLRLAPDDPRSRQLIDSAWRQVPDSVDELMTKWAFLRRRDGELASREQFLAELRPLLDGAETSTLAALRRQAWTFFNAGSDGGGDDGLIAWLCEGIAAHAGGISDPELAYIFALVKERRGDPAASVIELLTAALEGGFDPSWTRCHRGRLRESLGDAGGRDDLERAVLLGGEAATEAKALLAQASVDALWRHFDAREHAEVVRLAESLIAAGKSDPAIHYIFGMSLHEQGDRPDDALAQYDIALANGFDAAWTLFHRGRLRVASGDVAGRGDLERVLLLDGEAAAAARGLLAEISTAQVATVARPNEVDALWRHFHAGDHAAAILLAERLVQQGATDPTVNYVLGLSLHATDGRQAEALPQYDIALSRGFDPAWTRFHRGRLRLAMGDAGGIDDLELAASLGGPAGREAKQVIDQSRGARPRQDLFGRAASYLRSIRAWRANP
nr:glycosyltransferase [Falsiroseomonas frigidaquae]